MTSDKQSRIMFKGYSDEQWAEIMASVESAGLRAPHDFRGDVMMCWIKELHLEPGFFDDHEREYRVMYDAIVAVDRLLRPKIENGDVCEGRWEQCAIGRAYELALPALMSVARQIVHEATMNAEFKEWLWPAGRRPPPAKKYTQDSVQRRILKLWVQLGGEVNYGKKYSRFFRAVSHPVYESEYGKDQGLHWSDANTFRDHVKAWKARRYGRSKPPIGN